MGLLCLDAPPQAGWPEALAFPTPIQAVAEHTLGRPREAEEGVLNPGKPRRGWD